MIKERLASHSNMVANSVTSGNVDGNYDSVILTLAKDY